MQRIRSASVLLASISLFSLTVSAAMAQTVVNGSFELDSPGNNTTPTGWINLSFGDRVGINTSAGPYFDNGNTPDGNNVAILKAFNFVDPGFSQDISGFTVGNQYVLSFYDNRRMNYGSDPSLSVYVGGSLVASQSSVTAVGSGNDFYHVTANFTATAPIETLLFNVQSNGPGNSEADLFLDNVTINAVSSVPEPSQAAALGLGTLGLFGMILCVRKRSAIRA